MLWWSDTTTLLMYLSAMNLSHSSSEKHFTSSPQFVCLEGLITSISDMYPSYFFTGHRRKLLLLVIALVSFFVGLFMVTEVSAVSFRCNPQRSVFISVSVGSCMMFISMGNADKMLFPAVETADKRWSKWTSSLCLVSTKGRTLPVSALWLLCLQRNPSYHVCHSGVCLHWLGIW